MDIKLASLLLGAPDGAGFLFAAEGRVNVLARLRVPQAAFDAISEDRRLAVAAGSTNYGPAFVGILDLGVPNTRGEKQAVQFALDPTQVPQMDMIRLFAQERSVVLRAFDPTLMLLGVKEFPLAAAAQAVVRGAAVAAEGLTGLRPDPTAVAALPAGVIPFSAAAFAIAQQIRRYMPD